LEAGQHGIIFLADDGGPSDLYYLLVPVAPDAPLTAGDLAPIDAIKQYLLLSMKPGVTEETLASCIEGAIDLHLQAAADALVPLTRDNDPKIVGRALAGLVHFQDARAFPEAVEFILHPPQTAQVQALMVMCSVGMLTDPELAEAIIPLLSSADATCRRQALSALRHMKDLRNMPTLAAALSDADLENRYIAVMGLAETTGRWDAEWATSWPKFQGNPSYYVDKWLNWWESEGKAQYGSPAP
jgi:HEAT repeat protein